MPTRFALPFVAASVLLFAGSAAASNNAFLTRMDARVSGSSDVKVQTETDPAIAVLSNVSDHAVRCRVEFFKGLTPEGGSSLTIPPHGKRIARSPVAGPVGVINVDARCG